MKIKSLKLKNFAEFTDFECIFNDKITNLVGVNGSGKTTIGLTALWAGIKGIAENNKNGQLIGERFRFIGNQKASSDIEIIVFDEKENNEITITNHITKQSNQISCSPVQDSEWLNNFLSVAFLSAKNFCSTSSKEQALLLGIDTVKYDNELKELKTEYTLLNREYKSFGELVEIEKIDAVDYTALINEKSTIEAEYYNKQRIIDEHNQIVNTRDSQILDCNNKIEELDHEIKELQLKLKKCNEWKKNNPKLSKKENIKEPDTKDLTERIENTKSINEKAALYLTYKEKSEQKEAKKKELDNNQELQKSKLEERMKYIKSFKFGFDGLSVDDNGGLLLDGRPIKDPYFSKGELEIIVSKLYSSLKPDLKVRFIDDFELLDEDNQEKILKSLLDDGFQVITAQVGKEIIDNNTILLKECKIVDEYATEQKKLF